MRIKLFEHNQDDLDSVLKLLSETGKAAVIHPAGTGKSYIGTRFVSFFRRTNQNLFLKNVNHKLPKSYYINGLRLNSRVSSQRDMYHKGKLSIDRKTQPDSIGIDRNLRATYFCSAEASLQSFSASAGCICINETFQQR